MDWLTDNAVPIAGIAWGLLVLAGIAVLALSGWRLWRTVRATQGRLAEGTRALSVESRRVSEALAALPDRQAEITMALQGLSVRLAAAGVLARHASAAAAVLRGPLRYLGR